MWCSSSQRFALRQSPHQLVAYTLICCSAIVEVVACLSTEIAPWECDDSGVGNPGLHFIETSPLCSSIPAPDHQDHSSVVGRCNHCCGSGVIRSGAQGRKQTCTRASEQAR